MTSLERMMAAIRGEPFDRYPFVNPYPFWSMMPHWPEMLGLTFLHCSHGSDEERLRCVAALQDKLGLDWAPVDGGPCGQDRRFRIAVEGGVPVLHELATKQSTRFEEFPQDLSRSEPVFHSAEQVESLPPPATAEQMLASDGWDMPRKLVREFGSRVFLFGCMEGTFSACYRTLTFEGLLEAVITNPRLVHAISERRTEETLQLIRAWAQLGVHGFHINEFPCGGELLSDAHYREFVLPYQRRIFRAVKEAGLVAILEMLGWIEPRLKHIATLDIDCLQTECSMKGYHNDIGGYRQELGEEICLFSNSPIREVIEMGDEAAWRADAIQQARAIGKQQRFVICAGSPTTWATGPERLRRYGEFMRAELARLAPPRGA